MLETRADATHPTPAQSLTDRTATGFAWLGLRTAAAKVINASGQVFLAWLLTPESFGLVGLAYTVSAFVGLIQSAGVGEILVQRLSAFDKWANPAFWLSFTFGVLASLLMLVAAHLGAYLYREPELVDIISVLALSAPLRALSVVPRASLEGGMQYRYLATLGITTRLLTVALSVLMAWLGYGAYSLVVPQPIVALVEAAALWTKVRPPVARHFGIKHWRSLLPDSFLLVLVGLATTTINQADYMVLGLFHGKETVGVYFFAFGLSSQVLSILTANFASVLFPALARLSGDETRQCNAYTRATSTLAALTIPLCIVQALTMKPFIHLAFDSKWYGAIPAAQLLSLGWAMRMVAGPSGSLFKARGKFGVLLAVYIVYAILIVASVTIGALLGGASVVAFAVACCMAITGPMQTLVAVKLLGGARRDVIMIYLWPIAGSILAGIPAYALLRWTSESVTVNILLLLLIPVVVAAIYIPFLQRFAPANWVEIRRLSARISTRIARATGS